MPAPADSAGSLAGGLLHQRTARQLRCVRPGESGERAHGGTCRARPGQPAGVRVEATQTVMRKGQVADPPWPRPPCTPRSPPRPRDSHRAAGRALPDSPVPCAAAARADVVRRQLSAAVSMGCARSCPGPLPVRLPVVLRSLVPVLPAQAYLDVAVDDPGAEGRLRRGGGAAYVPAVREPEDAAVPRALDAPVRDGSLGQRSREVAAALGQRVNRPAGFPPAQTANEAAGGGPAARRISRPGCRAWWVARRAAGPRPPPATP